MIENFDVETWLANVSNKSQAGKIPALLNVRSAVGATLCSPARERWESVVNDRAP